MSSPLATALLVALAVLSALSPAGAQGPIFRDQVEVSWVLVPVVVRSRGDYVRELEKEDFRLYVDGRRVPVDSFDPRSDAPLSLVWLQDLSGSMANGGKLEASRRAFEFFLHQAQPDDAFAVATFAGGRLEVEVPFTSDLGALAEATARWQGWSTTALHDAVAWVPEISAEGRNRKRAVVLVTDGVDNASVLAPEVARMLVRRARLPVYVLGLTAGDPGEAREGGEETDRFAYLLERLARVSGGRFYPVLDPGRIEEAAAAVRDELRQQYVLGFPAEGNGPRSWRAIRVEVHGRRKVDLLHREGYIGGPPMAGGS